MKDNNTTPAMKEVEIELLSKAKDLAAQKHEYADWYQIDCLEIEGYEKDAIRAMLLDDVARIYAELIAVQWREENPVKPVAKEGVNAQSILSATGKTISTITHIELLRCMQEYAEAYHAAQLTEVNGEEKTLLGAQPLDGVKTVEEINNSFQLEATQILLELSNNEFAAKHIPLEDENFKDGYINGYIVGRKKSISENAQFATDAGGGKEPPLWYDVMSLDNYLSNQHYSKEIREELVKDYAENLQQAFKKGWEKGFNDIQKNGTWEYVYYRHENTKAPSTHSSSEMVSKEWISVEDRLPADNQTVTAKNRHSGQIGKEVVFKDGKFYHEFTSVNSLETTDVEFKNVTEWQAI